MTFPFTANNQDEFDAAIKERLAREAKKYEGFEGLKSKAAQLDEFMAKDYPGQLEKLQKDLAEAKATATKDLTSVKEQLVRTEKEAKEQAEKDAKSIADLTLSNLRVQVALEAGMPYLAADRLRGSTEEELREDAKSLAPYFTSRAEQPVNGNDPGSPGGGADVNGSAFFGADSPEARLQTPIITMLSNVGIKPN